MLGVIVNVVSIVVGSLIGLLLKNGLPEKIKTIVLQGVGLAVIIIGIMSAIATENVLLLVLSLVIGGVIGTLLNIDKNLEKLGTNLEAKFSKEDGGFAKGFVLASLVYCVGAMAILGSIEAGVEGDYTTLFVKSLLDGVTAIIFTASLGIGVMFSIVPVFLYQGFFVLLGIQIEPYLTDQMITEMSAVGGVLIMGIGITMLEIKELRLGDLLPSIFIPIIYLLLF
jgi:uncharacterized membrane protein YqgA involved in biofilm formation